MAIQQIDLEVQSQDLTLTREKLVADFLNGSNLDVTGGNNNATLTGLANGTANDDAVNVGQMNAAIAAGVVGGMTYKGTLDASDATGATLDGAVTGDLYYISVAGTLDGIAYNVGDHLVANADITDFDVDGTGKIDIIDNTESSNLLRNSDVVNDLTTGGTDVPLSAQQGVVLKGLVDNQQIEIDAIEAGAGLNTDGTYTPDAGSNYITGASSLKNADSLLDAQIKVNSDALAAFGTDVYNEKPATTVGNAVLAPLTNIPATDVRVYWNGLRADEGAGNDYTVNLTTGVITMAVNMKNKDKIQVDYKY